MFRFLTPFTHKPKTKKDKEEQPVSFLNSGNYSTRVGKMTLEEDISGYCE